MGQTTGQSTGQPMVLCPYCGSLSALAKQCNICSGYFDLLSRQRSQNAMGPWFVRELSKPFQPGCSYATLVRMAQRGKIKPETVLRGPSTRQFWSFARQTPGVAHLLGECHACHTPAQPTATACASCRASFVIDDDRQTLGLSPVHLLPGDADAATIARSLGSAPTGAAPRDPTRQTGSMRPAPTPPAPFPEPQVIVEEPEWIDEPAPHRSSRSRASRPQASDPHASRPRKRADTSPPSRLGIIIALLIVILMMSGAGVWAWLHLSKRTDERTQSTSTPELQAPTTGTESTPPENVTPTTGDPASQPPEPTPETPDPDLGLDPEAPPSPAPIATESNRPDPDRLAYDRILVGIANGTLDEADFEAELAAIDPSRHASLRRAWERRTQQVRLGRRGE